VKFIVDNWHLLLVAFVSGAMLVWPMVRRSGGGGAVSPNEAVRLINREKGVLVDVSEPHEYAAGHAAGSKNVPFGQIEKPKELPSNKALPILLMCPTGARAGRAAGVLRKAGYEKAVAVAGGTAAWREAGLPIDKAAVKSSDKATA
jgi:rhodanese-related sulfurtransferase